MTLHTITLALPQILPQHADCECCAAHLLDALRSRIGVTMVRLDAAALILEVDEQLVAASEAEQIARDTGLGILRRYDHPVFTVDGLDCADCAKNVEHALNRMPGVHYALLNFTAARLRLEYDREQTSVDTIVSAVSRLGYVMRSALPARNFACGVEGMCCAAESVPIELAVRALPGVQHVFADPALARLSVTYDAQALTSEHIIAQVEQLGFRVHGGDAPAQPDTSAQQPQSSWGQWLAYLRARPRDLLAVLCGVLIAGAWLFEWLGVFPPFAAACYMLATVVGAWPIARNGWATLRATRLLDINLLMTIAAVGALLIGEYAEGAAVVFLFTLGNALEGYTMERARRSLRALMNMAPETARVLHDGEEHEHAVGEVDIGETIVIRPGDRVPLDSVVLGGTSMLNQAPITGESIPVSKTIGAELFAGSINGDGALEARVTRPAQDSTLARIIHMVEEAQAQKSQAQRFINVFARYYTPAVLVFAVLVALLPALITGGSWLTWLYRALVLLVIACPCALVISTPVSIVSAISAAARAGVLFKGGAALEAAGGLRALAFDKTGTLTLGQPTVTHIIAFRHAKATAEPLSDQPLLLPQAELLGQAAAVERRSTHPLARAIVSAAEERGLIIPVATNAQAQGGRGAQALVAGQTVKVGNRAMFAEQTLAPAVDATLNTLERAGRTAILIGDQDAIWGVIAMADQARPESRAALAALKQQGIAHIVMLTGDTTTVAERVAADVGVDSTRAELLPEQKLAEISELLTDYGSVGMIGDGVNDAPALASATVGIAMGVAGSDAALETADVTLMADDLTKLPFAIGLSRAARQVIIQNIVFALVVKAIFLVATLFGAATLWMAVFADTGAALIVIANGMRLLRYRA